jgi:Ca-activated chloride channel family protein
MKRLALSALLAAAATTCLVTPPAQATGWIMIDPIGGVAPVMPPTTVPSPGITPIRPRPGTTLPRPSTVTLHGHVSVGLHLQAAAVRVEIKDQIAKTYITQTFSNDSDRNLAGTYLFPLPDDTTFSSFSLHIDGKPVEGKILEAQAARQEYESIVRRMVDPGLLEFADSKTVRARIFPIPAHGTKKVELEYTQILKAENGLLKYRFPLKSGVEDSPADEIKVDVKIASAQGLRTIWSPTHTVKTVRADNLNAKVSLNEKDTLPDKDFLLYYSVSNNELAANLITHKAEGQDGYFLMTLSPPMQSKAVIGKDVVLVADTSGSMQGAKMEENKRALKYVVNALHPSDRFGLVEFNTDAETFKNNLVAATPENKKAACAFIDDLMARGGTNIGEAISIGKTLLAEENTRPAYMIFMTDGEPTVGERDAEKLIALANSKKDIRVFDFGVGYDINTKLLNKLAESHHGTSQYVEPNENLETALASFYDKIKSPVLSDVKIAYDGIEVKNTYPREVKDIFAGSQVLLLGRYKHGGSAKINLTGKVSGSDKSFSFPLNFATSQAGNSHLSKLWAMRRIGYLTEVAHSNGENREVIDEIVALSKQHGIISEYTSYLVTDPSENGRLAQPAVAFRGPSAGRNVAHDRRRVASRLDAPRPMSLVAEGSSVRGSLPPVSWGKSVDSSGLYKTGRQIQIVDESPSIGALRNAGSFGSAMVSGKMAVVAAKERNELKNSYVIADKGFANTSKTVGDKTFFMNGGTWIDSSVKDTSRAIVIAFGSKEYFDLLKNQPGIAKYLSVGKQVTVTFNGNVYKIVQSRSATG